MDYEQLIAYFPDDPKAERLKEYKTQKWKRFRQAQLDKQPWCCECRVVKANTVDHIRPHGDDWRLWFYVEDNVQSMCKPCHSRKTTTVDDVANGNTFVDRLAGSVRVRQLMAGGGIRSLGSLGAASTPRANLYISRGIIRADKNNSSPMKIALGRVYDGQ